MGKYLDLARAAQAGVKKWCWSGRPGYALNDALEHACYTIHPKSYLEIGVNGGGSLRAVYSRAPLDLIILCDNWSGRSGYHGHGHIADTLRVWDYKGHVMYLDGDSKVEIPKLQDEPNKIFLPLDLILIDGDHSPGAANTDLENVWPLLRPGGLLVVDDVSNSRYPHVRHEFHEFTMRHQDAVRVPEDKGGEHNCAMLTKVE